MSRVSKGSIALKNNDTCKERVAEWLKAADCKFVDIFYAGSNPASLKKVGKSVT
jgi:hypothetical protein